MSCKLPLVPKATYTILGFTMLIYLLQMASMAILNEDDLLLMLGTRVITPVFIHGSVTHIFF